jgi:hypothetical protein
MKTDDREILAQGEFTRVERCGCGNVYLTVGPVCIKLAACALPELRETLAQAAVALGIAADLDDGRSGDAN